MNAAERTIEAVATAWEIAPEALTGAGRSAIVAEARSAAMHLLRGKGLSFAEVARALGRSDHTTAITACKVADTAIKTNAAYRQRYERASKLLGNFEQWRDGRLNDMQALRALCMDLGEVTSELDMLKQQEQTLREQISIIIERTGTTDITGFGRLEITNPSVIKTFDKAKLNELVYRLQDTHPEIADLIDLCRDERLRAGSLRITREKTR